MASKFIALAEEYTFRTAGTSVMYFKLLNEDIVTTREDFYPETTQGWTPQKRAEGFFRTTGSFTTLVEPVQFPKILVLYVGDPTTTGPTDSAYTHIFKFGATESVAATEVKPFTTTIGVGIEKDRQIEGCVMESLQLESVARDVVTARCGIIGSGDESLITALTPSYTNYSQPYFTFASATTMTVGAADRLVAAPTIEAFRINLTRGWDTDHYVLGNRFLAAPSLSGMASVTGSMDFSFTSEDEHERFLTSVGSYAAGDQASFAISLKLEGALIGTLSKYTVQLDLAEVHYKVSTPSVSSRDRIVQRCDFISKYNSSDASAAKFTVINATESYTALS